MEIDAVMRLKYGYEFLCALRDDGCESFSRAMGRLGCQPRSMVLLGRVCLKTGLVTRPGRKYELTDTGYELLRIWEQIRELGRGMTAADSDDWPPGDELAPFAPAEKADKVARVRAALEASSVKATVETATTGQRIYTNEFSHEGPGEE